MSPNIFGGHSSIPMSTLQFQRDISSSHSEFNPSGSSYTKTFACGVGGGGEAVEELKAKVEEEREKCKEKSNKVRALQVQLKEESNKARALKAQLTEVQGSGGV